MSSALGGKSNEWSLPGAGGFVLRAIWYRVGCVGGAGAGAVWVSVRLEREGGGGMGWDGQAAGLWFVQGPRSLRELTMGVSCPKHGWSRSVGAPFALNACTSKPRASDVHARYPALTSTSHRLLLVSLLRYLSHATRSLCSRTPAPVVYATRHSGCFFSPSPTAREVVPRSQEPGG
ncbi:hypothetical protein CVT26_005297 [Gymnopilus dilepis]|uniref:Uncharacterized protein n=1 Tax=Gymnopilus dilepis TaxID=231916 RepID=A0A409YSV5_9AGAR|nr:hypothetical protein CVT26_005297 [Gymnopilus dilepis]